jgi:predicted CoA-binding protein
MLDGNPDEIIYGILATTRRIALVGASVRAWRRSFGVTRVLLDNGYDVTPVNPGLAGQMVHGRNVVATLAEAAPLDMVAIFRASQHVGAVVDRAIRLGARTIWMPLRVFDHIAAARARAAGLAVVMDRCPVTENRRLTLGR